MLMMNTVLTGPQIAHYYISLFPSLQRHYGPTPDLARAWRNFGDRRRRLQFLEFTNHLQAHPGRLTVEEWAEVRRVLGGLGPELLTTYGRVLVGLPAAGGKEKGKVSLVYRVDEKKGKKKKDEKK
jgi:hypothetical protein